MLKKSIKIKRIIENIKKIKKINYKRLTKFEKSIII